MTTQTAELNRIHEHAHQALQITIELQALMLLMQLIDDENAVQRIGEMHFMETMLRVGKIGERLTSELVHHISLAENALAPINRREVTNE